LVLAIAQAAGVHADNWPHWRGPNRDGSSREKGVPIKWTTEENVAWKLAMPDRSGATPIIWGDRIFLNVAQGDAIELWCVDRKNGSVLWKRPLSGGNVMMRKQNMSSPSPVTDGKTVWVMTGTGFLRAFDFAGQELWMRDIQKDYGAFGLNWGYASSPLLHDGGLFVQVLHGMKTDDPSYILRIEPASGKTLWRVERPTDAVRESPDAYTTPAVAKRGSAWELVISGGDYVTGHDPKTGKELWRSSGLNPQKESAYRIIASPLVYEDMVYAPTRVRPMLALRTGGSGDVTESHRVFTFENGPDVPTPVTDGSYLYVVNDRGVVFVIEAKTGKPVYGPERLKPGTYSASPVIVDGHIYITSEEGLTSVFKAGPKFEVVAENAANGEYTLSSIAVSDGQIFLRTAQNLYCIGSKTPRR
jgi:outer membrane protein assembly factor BamB